MYEIRYSNTAQRYFKKIKEKGLKTAFRTALERIGEEPYCGTLKIGDLAGSSEFPLRAEILNFLCVLSKREDFMVY